MTEPPGHVTVVVVKAEVPELHTVVYSEGVAAEDGLTDGEAAALRVTLRVAGGSGERLGLRLVDCARTSASSSSSGKTRIAGGRREQVQAQSGAPRSGCPAAPRDADSTAYVRCAARRAARGGAERGGGEEEKW